MSPVVAQIHYPAVLDFSRQSAEVPGTKRPGQTAHYRNALWGLLDPNSPSVLTTLPQLFDSGFAKSADKPFTGYRPVVSSNPLTYAKHFIWSTYRQVDEHRRNIGSALTKMFKEGKVGGGDLPTVGIWCSNRPEWQWVDLALHAYGMVGVSLYDTFGPDAVEYIINHAELTIIFAASQHIPTLVSLLPKIPHLKVIVSVDELSPQVKNVLRLWGKEKGVEVTDLTELESIGRSHPLDLVPVTPDQIATLCYTSGTTSTPKGAVLTHLALATSVHSCIHGAKMTDPGILLSYLPLAHIYERVCELLVIALGGQIGYFTGDPLRLLEDAQILRPTYFPSVPRVLNRLWQAAMAAAAAPGLKGALFRKACAVKLQKLHETGDNTHAVWDRLVFRKIQAVLGGRIETLTCGSAPISTDAMDFLKIALSCDVVEGYGMTENCGTCTRVWVRDPSSTGTVGAPQPSLELKLVDVPAMGYTSEDKPFPRGEICSRGPGCFKSYYKDPKNTAATIDAEGWLHTGDIGELDNQGRFKIIDRIKNIMKLSQGEYVALEKVENVYSACPLVQQIYVHGDSLQSHLVAVIIPDPPVFAKFASKVSGRAVQENDVDALSEVSRENTIISALLEELGKEADKGKLRGFETVKAVHISWEPFTMDNGLLTPTFKLKRREVYLKYKKALNELYSSSQAKL